MATRTTAPPLVVNGPLPVIRPYRLVDTATIIEDPDIHYEAGVQVYSYPPDLPHTWDPCPSGSRGLKVEGGVIPLPIFGGFQVYVAETCQSRGIGPDQQAFMDRALAVFAAVESHGVELELSQGIVLDEQPFFCDAERTLLAGGAAVKPAVGLALLEQAIGATARGGMLHATPGTVAMWDSLGYTLDVKGQKLVSRANGTPISVGTGYIGAQPDGGTAPTETKSWAFATGPIDVRRGRVEVLPDNVKEALNRSTNQITYRVERNYVVDWDTVLQAAVYIDWAL